MNEDQARNVLLDMKEQHTNVEIRIALDMAIEKLKEREWIPCSERLPEEHVWIGTKQFGTTISDTILITFDVHGTRFVKPMSLQNGELSNADKKTMDVFYKGWKMLAWMPLPKPYGKGDTE